VAWFARLHGVPLADLLAELNESTTSTVAESIAFRPSLADTIYRPFFIAGIVTVLTLGCTWGALNLLTIGLKQSFTAVNYSWVLAHAHAMVFGFVGFFIVGFAYQAFPRFKHTTLWRPRLAFSALPIMAIGILLQTMAHLLVPNAAALKLMIVSASFQLEAVFIFALVIVKTARRAKKTEPYDRFVYAAASWFLLAAIANPLIFILFELPADHQRLLFNLATYNIPYRDVQLLGIAVVMIVGVSLRFLPHAYGFPEPSYRWRTFLFWGLNGSILVGAISFLVGMSTGNHWLLIVQWLTAIVLLVIAIGTLRQYRLFGEVQEAERDRGLKFIRAAHVWFIIAMVLLVLTPFYNFGLYLPFSGSHVPFSHAFFGAYRHALTVGFIMMMIVGVSSKVVPTLTGFEMRRASSLWLTFVLLNLGNALRVSTEIATDFVPSAYRILGISGFIEVAALTLWGYELLRNMFSGRRLEEQSAKSALPGMPIEISAQMKVAEVLDYYPQTLQTFIEFGFAPLRNPVLRTSIARVVTIEQACRRGGVVQSELLSELRRVTSLTGGQTVITSSR
jgi:uncharacterized protein involved in response to NO